MTILCTNRFGHMTLAWDADPNPSSVGYRLSYGTSSGVYTNSVDVGPVTQVKIQNLPVYNGNVAQLYYWIVQSVDDGNNLIGVPSNEASGTVLPG